MIQKSSKVSIAYDLIKKRILSGVYKYGETLSANALSDELDMSRTPILEAYKILESEGMVRVVPQVGVVVTPLNIERIKEVFSARAVLEGYMAGEASRASEKSDYISELEQVVQNMEHCLRNNDQQRYAKLNILYHELILDMANLPFIKELVMKLWDQSHYFVIQNYLYKNHNMKRSFDEHVMILDFIKNNHVEKARSSMEKHILLNIEKICELSEGADVLELKQSK